MSQNTNHRWIQKLNIKSVKENFLTQIRRLNYFLNLPKQVYEKHPKLVLTLGITTLLIGGGLSYMISKQQAALYFPDIGWGRQNNLNPRGLRHPQQRGLEADDLEIVTEDRVTLRGWHIKNNDANKIIVYFHGNAGNIGTRLSFVKQLIEQTNSEVILVGYRGYSDSDGVPTQKGLQKDAQAILLQAIKISKRTNKKLYVFGTSLGGAVTIYVSGVENVRQAISGLIVQNTFTSTTDVLPFHAPFLRTFVPILRLVNRNSWDSLGRISKLRRPILFIKCGMDEIIPAKMTDKLREECNKHHIHNYLYEIPNGRHNEVHINDPTRYFNQVNQFFNATL